MKQLLLLLTTAALLLSQPVHPLQPSFLAGTISAGYERHKQVKNGFHLSLNADLGTRFSPFPPQWGTAPYIGLSAKTRYIFGKNDTTGFGIDAFTETDFMLNPIFYKGERYDMDPIWSLSPGASLFWRFQPKTLFFLEPYGSGRCRFFTSLGYNTGIIPFLSLEIGLRASITGSQIRQWRHKRNNPLAQPQR